MDDGLFHHRGRPRVDVVFGERGLRLGGLAHRLGQRAFADRASADDARLVQVDVGLDQPAANQPAAGVVFRRVADEAGRDGGDRSRFDSDIRRLNGVRQAGVANDEINGHAARLKPSAR